jgi:hypothetical protein
MRRKELDPHTHEAMARFVRLLAHCGITPDGITRGAIAACRELPNSVGSESVQEPLPYRHHTSHILTLWFSDPKFLRPDGTPRPLPVRGKEESIEALAKQVDSRLDADEVVRFLERARALRREGDRYVPRERMMVLRGSGVAASVRKLRVLLGVLRTFDHNQRPKGQVPGWFEAFAYNPSFPVRAIPSFDGKMRAQANKLLVQLDGDMHREERLRDPAEPTVRIVVGVYRFEETLSTASKPRKKRASPKSRRTR